MATTKKGKGGKKKASTPKESTSPPKKARIVEKSGEEEKSETVIGRGDDLDNDATQNLLGALEATPNATQTEKKKKTKR